MPRMSYAQLQRQNGELMLEIGALSTDPEWKILKREAIPFRLQREPNAAWVVIVRIFNAVQWPGLVRRAMNVRDATVLLRARWDEETAIFVLSSTPANFAEKLVTVCENENLIVSIAYVEYKGHIQSAYERAAARILFQSELLRTESE